MRKILAETERLRAALLTSISHDLRTPLASILGAVSSLRAYADWYDAAQREELLATLQGEAERLNRFVANLLDMTRLESGAIELRLELFDLTEISARHCGERATMLARHRVEVDLAPDLPMVRLDAVLFEQVLFNLLDNAAKYAPAGSGIELRARLWHKALVIEVCDEGPGIPPARPRAGVRQILSGGGAGPPPRRHRPRPGHLPRLCRGAWRADHRPQSARGPSGAILRISLPIADEARRGSGSYMAEPDG